MTTMTSMPGPVQAGERIHIVDILRGFALLGILLVNMELFAQPVQTIFLLPDAEYGLLDQIAAFFVRWFAEGKFYALFSFLFGLGFTIQMERAEAAGARFWARYLRRSLALLAFGLIHAFLFWVGDILAIYAVTGLLLLIFRKARPRTLLVWIVIFLLLPILFNLTGWGLLSLGRAAGPQAAEMIDAQMAAQEQVYVDGAAKALQIYANGNFAQVTAQRAEDYLSFVLTGNLFIIPSILAMFLLGMYFGKRGLLRDAAAHLPLFRRLLVWGLGLGLLGNLVYAINIAGQSRLDISGALVIATIGQGLTAPLLMLGYVSAFVLLYHQPAWQKRLETLAPVGRMALSNYILQSTICTLIFYGYGLGLFGQVGKAGGVLLAVGIYLLQIPLSHWWMRRFAYGPLEWLWRTLTYLRPQPWRVKDGQG